MQWPERNIHREVNRNVAYLLMILILMFMYWIGDKES